MKIKRGDLVKLITDLPDFGLNAGQLGEVVTACDQKTFDVEFLQAEGSTRLTLARRAIERAHVDEIPPVPESGKWMIAQTGLEKLKRPP